MRAVLLIVLAAIQTSCVTTVYTTAPSCPVWSADAQAELEWILGTSKFPALEEAIGRQELYCTILEPEPLREEVCMGSWLGCWWRSL